MKNPYGLRSPLKVEMQNINNKIGDLNRSKMDAQKKVQALWDEINQIDAKIFGLKKRRKEIALKLTRDSAGGIVK